MRFSQGQCYVGTWVKGSPKCGQVVDLERDAAANPPEFALPQVQLQRFSTPSDLPHASWLSQLKLQDAHGVLQQASAAALRT